MQFFQAKFQQISQNTKSQTSSSQQIDQKIRQNTAAHHFQIIQKRLSVEKEITYQCLPHI